MAKEQPRVFHFETEKNFVSLTLPNNQVVEFIGKFFTTDSEETANQVKETKMFKSGKIWSAAGIKKSNRYHSGARATA